MFERFTPDARQVVVRAQEESRRLKHNYIGTEHVLLGLLSDPGSTAAQALDAVGVTLDGARDRIEAAVGRGKRSPTGHIPFTPRAKKLLELALREALSLGHDYIGTEHILLGVVREGEGLGARVLVQTGVDLEAFRRRVLDLIPPADAGSSRRRRFWSRQRFGPPVPVADDVRTTAATDVSLDEARRLAGDAAVGSHHLLLATLSDPTSAAAKALGTLGIDLEQARSALRDVDVSGTTDELPEEAGRRQLVMRLRDSTLTLETTEPALVDQARAAIEAIGASGGIIRGDDEASRGFADLWQAWNLSLQATTAAAARRP